MNYAMNIKQRRFGEERALYAISSAEIRDCTFAGEEDGESALKETAELYMENCDFQLRYPLWHARNAELNRCRMSETCRAAMWYDDGLKINESALNGIKALRECRDVEIAHTSAVSAEFGWFCRGIKARDFELAGEYPFMHSADMEFDDLQLNGKYSFQYVENATIRNSVLDTKDAFWHSKNVTVVDSVIRGEYLAWYSEGLRLVRCKIIGTQPLCYCRGLVMEDCEMEKCDLAFENSEVRATVRGHIDSVKNPVSGFLTADSIGEVILDEFSLSGECPITAGGKRLDR